MYSSNPSPQEKKPFSRLKLLWYGLATVLVLSLPTFSLVVPRQDYLQTSSTQETEAKTQAKRSSYSSSDLSSGPTRWAYSMPESSIWGRSSRARSIRNAQRSARRTFPRNTARRAPSRSRNVERPQRIEAETPKDTTEQGDQESSGELGDALDPFDQSQILEALAGLQQDYEMAYETTFQGNMARNPFLGALNRNYGGGGSVDGGSDGNNSGGDGNGSSSGGEGGDGGSSGGDTGGGSDPNVDVVEPPPDQVYDFLIIGNFIEGVNQPFVSRGWRDGGNFFLDNFTRFTFFPGFVHSLLVFKESDRIWMTDLNRDGRKDFVVARQIPNVGTSVESFLSTGLSFQLHASTLFYLQTVRSLSTFDFDGDGGQELAILTEGRNRLWILKEINREWRYLKEMVLPITASFLFRSGLETGFEKPFLYIADQTAQELVSITPDHPGSFRLGSLLPPGVLLQSEVSLRPGSQLETFVLSLPDLLLVLEERNGGLVPFVGADLNSGVPTLIIGDYGEVGSRQVLWVP